MRLCAPKTRKKRSFPQSVTSCHQLSLCAHGNARMRQRIPVPRGHPRNIPGSKSSQTRMIAWSRENIPNIPKIPTPFVDIGDLAGLDGCVRIFVSAHDIRTHKRARKRRFYAGLRTSAHSAHSAHVRTKTPMRPSLRVVFFFIIIFI